MSAIWRSITAGRCTTPDRTGHPFPAARRAFAACALALSVLAGAIPARADSPASGRLVGTAATAEPFTAAIHGNVVAVDRARGLLTVHHKAHAGMPIEMTMVVRMRDEHALASLKTGQFVHLRCDERRNPWVCVRR
jgi:Cu/Ag efflux protein CusF